MMNNAQQFFAFALEEGILEFGKFTLKSGRLSPYFLNLGNVCDGYAIAKLGSFYAHAIHAAGTQFDMLFGPAYKGIPLVAATAIAFSQQLQRRVPFAFNRKESKDHGEGGVIVGSPLHGRVLIVDDVITAGTAVRQSIRLIETCGAQAVCLAVAFDREEKGLSKQSALSEVSQEFGLQAVCVSRVTELIAYVSQHPQYRENIAAMQNYLREYGA